MEPCVSGGGGSYTVWWSGGWARVGWEHRQESELGPGHGASTVGIRQAWLAGGWIPEVRKTRQCSCLECCPSLLSFNFSLYVGVGAAAAGEGC